MTKEKVEVKTKSYRWLENIHIVMWLIKDTCWALVWKPGAIAMIIPTVSVAIYLLYRSKRNKTELYHNAAVCMWIIANSTWMLGEFMNKELRPVAVVLFGIGLGILAIYYSIYFKKDRIKERIKENF
jgi:hypothetical protein